MNIDWSKIPSPTYVLDEKILAENLKLLESVQDKSGAKIILALKAFAMFSCFDLIKKYLGGCAASSLHEARLAYEEMGGEVHVYAPAYLDNEFDSIMGYCSHITFNSLSQWERFQSKITSFSKKISCGLRINPEYSEVEIDLYNPCGVGSRFGVRASDMPSKLPKGIDGLHFHTLCENGSEELSRTLEKVEEKFASYLHQASWLNMGGGHLMTRKGYNIELLLEKITHLQKKYDLKIILEPGGAIAWQTGYLVSTVLDILQSGDIQVAILDISFTAHMPDCLEMPYKPQVIGATDGHPDKASYRLGGTTCLSGDFMGMGDYAFEKPLKIGDKVVFKDMMHYTMVKTTHFNGVKHPNIGIWRKDNRFALIKEFGYEDYKEQLS